MHGDVVTRIWRDGRRRGGAPQMEPTILYVDNSGAVALSKDLKSCQRSRHGAYGAIVIEPLSQADEVKKVE